MCSSTLLKATNNYRCYSTAHDKAKFKECLKTLFKSLSVG